MNFWQFAIPIGVALTAVVLNAWINVHIKFAPTREEAVAALKGIAFRVFGWVVYGLNGLTVYLLIRTVLSPQPVTRGVVFLIAFQVASLVVVVVMSVTMRMMTDLAKVLTRTVDTVIKTNENMRDHVTATREHIANTTAGFAAVREGMTRLGANALKEIAGDAGSNAPKELASAPPESSAP